MEVAFSAILGEITHRSVSFFIEKLSKEAASLTSDENLHRKLLRVRIIVEEAEGRKIRTQAMLDQLKVLRAGMYRGYYVLDTFKYRAYREEDHGAVSSPYFALSKFNPAKRIHLLGGSRNNGGEKEMHQVIGSLEIMITDASEFVVFLTGCPPLLYRQPYGTYMIMEKCMFSRHVEVECIINFLMQKCSLNLDVLPIVGPMKAGKSTLIEHACNDERVRMAFSRIVLFTEDDLDERVHTSVGDGGTVKHQSYASDRDERVLISIEVNGDIHENTLSSIYSTSKRYPANGSKVIISSRSEQIARFGTTRPLKVEYPTQEAYWYFFKALAFGSANPKEEPKLASMAMDIAACMNSSFIATNMMACMLRANFSVRFWHMVLLWIKEVRKRSGFIFGGHPVSPWQNTKPASIPRINNPNEYCWIFNDHQIVSAHDEAQEITLQEVLLRDVVPHGKYDVLVWRSSLPPHSSCIISCEVNNKASKLNVQKKLTHS